MRLEKFENDIMRMLELRQQILFRFRFHRIRLIPHEFTFKIVFD